MKKEILMFIIVLPFTYSIPVLAQSECDPNKIIRTDPGNPENTEKAMKKNGPTNGDPNQPQNGNIFNWLIDTEHNPAFRLNSSVMVNDQQLNSPFWEYNNSRTQIFINQWANNSRIDNLPEDGWELIHQDFGYFDNGNARGVFPNGGQKVDYPHIILYNRFTGVLRAFVNIGGLSGNTASIRLEFERGGTVTDPYIQTSLLDMTYSTEDKPLNALDNFRGSNSTQNQARVSGLSEYLGQGAHWYYADFPMMYDACTCQKKSKIHLYVELVKKAKISLKGSINGEIIDKNDLADNNTVKTLQNDGASSYSIGEIWNQGKKAAEKTAQSYRDISAFTTGTLDRLESYHFVGPNISVKMQEEIAKNKEVAKASLTDLDKIIDLSGDWGKDLLKIAPFVGAAFSVVDFFTAGGASPAGPQKVSISPMAVNLTVNLEGEIESRDNQKNFAVWNPGSDIPNLNNVDYEYPYYNQTMGVMNLWKTPSIKKYEFTKLVPNEVLLDNYFYLKIPNDIEFVINPSAGFNMTPSELDISASLVIDFGQSVIDNVEFNNEGLFQWINEHVVSTPLIPIGCLKNIDPGFILHKYNPQLQYQQQVHPKFYLKIIANLQRADRTQNTQNVIWEGTYRYNVETTSHNSLEEIESYYQIANPIGQFAKDVELNSTNGIISSNKTAWRTMTIKSGTTFSTSQPITIKAGYKIEVEPEVDIPANVELVLGLPFECTSVLGPKTSISAADCNANSYLHNRSFNRLGEQPTDSAADGLTVFPPTESSVTALPNPSTGQTVMQYSIAQQGFAQLTVSDALGRQIATLIDNSDHPQGRFEIRFGSSELPSGVYYYTLRTGTFVQTKKLLIIR